MHKLFINKNDDPSEVVEKILSVKEKDIVLVIPKFSKLADSVSNFHLIKREAEADGKNIVIESVDDDCLALSQAAKLVSINPFLTGRRKSMSDIIAPDESTPKTKSKKESSEDVTVSFSNNNEEVPGPESDEVIPAKRRLLPKRSTIFGAVIITSLALFIGVRAISPQVSITLNVKDYPWEFNEPVKASVAALAIDLERNIISGTILSEKKSVTESIPASGEKKVERKATGLVNIYNAFSSSKQPLVATTRLLTPDGKLFRLVDGITVPGAKVANGQITPSSIEAKVIADKPGEEYNIGPVSRFSIPGFQGSSKYEGFYADSSESMSGGLIGTISYPTDEDFATAKVKITNLLKDGLNSFSIGSVPEGFAVLPEAAEFSLLDVKVDETADSSGQVTVLGEAELKAIAFPEKELTSLIESYASKSIGFPVSVNNQDIKLTNIKPNFSNGVLNFSASFSGSVSRAIDKDDIKQAVSGQSSDSLQAYVVSLSGVDGAKISLWPFWLKSAPADVSKIEIKTNHK